MASFAETLKQQAPVGTHKHYLETITLGGDKKPWLEMRYAGKGNPGYQSAILKLAEERRRRVTSKITERTIQEDREQDAELFAQHVIVGWGEVYDEGKPAACTPDRVKELLFALIEHHEREFVGILIEGRNPVNFQSATAGPELGKG